MCIRDRRLPIAKRRPGQHLSGGDHQPAVEVEIGIQDDPIDVHAGSGIAPESGWGITTVVGLVEVAALLRMGLEPESDDDPLRIHWHTSESVLATFRSQL